ncbi:MAG TPA: tyrosine-type recombinase/integrase [Tissierellaceae bacterium]|nr:tyrosine-type recombinase/integrase [Tissierellaceae bacterium]
MLRGIRDEYTRYIEKQKKLSKNTVEAYTSDIEKFSDFMDAAGINNVDMVNNTHVIRYLLQLQREGKSTSTISRHLASIRCLFEYLINNGKVKEDPTLNLKPPKKEKKMPQILTEEEINRLMGLPDSTTAKGARDRALLELLYSSGLRVSEINSLKIGDILLSKGTIVLSTESGIRKVPVGSKAIGSISYYLKNYRDENNLDAPLFVNYSGKKLTRQGLWKIIRTYADKVSEGNNVTPQILRNSFAAHILSHGADIKTVQEIMGHTDIASTQVYTMTEREGSADDVYKKAHPRA